ncbi:MAG TPA: lipoyl(octanoyl) transferase LipB [Polyangia bacterium]|jgi:lipoyl(octanoyl) transferase
MTSDSFAWAWLGRVRYGRALALQEELRRRILDGEGGDTLLLLEHEPVVTLGRHADPANVLLPKDALAASGVEVVETTRGGDVTYHGPGQLVGYPVFRLRRGVVDFLETLGAALTDVCAGLGVRLSFCRQPAGLWVGNEKLVAFGLHVHRDVSIHGFALNARTPLEAFRAIVPCGLRAAGVTSLARQCGPGAPAPAELAPGVAAALARVLGRPAAPVVPEALWDLL